MKRVLVDSLAYGKQFLRSKIGAFFTFIFPLLLILLFGAVFANVGSSTFDLPVQDLDDSGMSHALLAALGNTTVVRISMVSAGTNLQEHIRSNSLSVALQIPAGFERSILLSLAANGTAWANVTVFGDPSRSAYQAVIGVVRAVAEQMNFGLVRARPIVGVDTASVVSAQFQAIDFFVPGIIGITVMTNALYIMTGMCAEYRTRKYFKLLATTTLTKAEWLTSKILWFSMILLVSFFITIAVGIWAWGVHVRIDAISIAFVVVGVILFASMGMVLGSFVKDPESASAVANAIGFPMMFLSGSFWQLEVMPPYLQAVARVFPLTYMNDGLRDIMVLGNVDRALVNLAIMAVLAAIFFVVGAKAMSWKER